MPTWIVEGGELKGECWKAAGSDRVLQVEDIQDVTSGCMTSSFCMCGEKTFYLLACLHSAFAAPRFRLARFSLQRPVMQLMP